MASHAADGRIFPFCIIQTGVLCLRTCPGFSVFKHYLFSKHKDKDVINFVGTKQY